MHVQHLPASHGAVPRGVLAHYTLHNQHSRHPGCARSSPSLLPSPQNPLHKPGTPSSAASPALVGEHLPDLIQVPSLAHKAGRNQVDLICHTPVDDVIDILLCQGGQVDHDAGQVDVLALTVVEGKSEQGRGRERSVDKQETRGGSTGTQGQVTFLPTVQDSCDANTAAHSLPPYS